MRTARLLLVDDNPDNLEMLTVLLSEKYSVSSCGSAAEALTVLEASRPDLLILDVRMTPVDGLQCLEAIRAMPGYSSTPAIALTAFAREAERQASLAAGFQAVVTKPILDERELETLIDTLLKSACSLAASSPQTSAEDRCWNESIVSPPLTHTIDDGMISGGGLAKK
jgi:two-component system, OmpR family, aerobic respiration control sensor histidine kinase ArcB